VTLADLVPRQRVTGGSQRRVFGADPVTGQEIRMNLTFVRAAKPAKDLPPRKDVKGGKKVV
jgi:hypothetical protein